VIDGTAYDEFYGGTSKVTLISHHVKFDLMKQGSVKLIVAFVFINKAYNMAF
jgi:hypothetical protein